jgi:hypothetical protein
MYNPGSIADRLRELQRETDAAYARLNFVHSLLGEAYNKIHILENQNTSLKLQLETLIYTPETKIPLSSEHKVSDIPDNTEYQISDISDNTKLEDLEKPKRNKRN